MSCPDWKSIAAARSTDPLVDPPGFAAARAHLAVCESCRRGALAADPLLLFSRLPGAAATDAVVPGTDAAMAASVLAMVRASRVAAHASDPAAPRPARSARLSAAAAAILFATLLALPGSSPRTRSAAAPETATGPDSRAIERWIEATESSPPPVIEEIDRPDARVYDLSYAELAVVMIVDSSLDV
jgi:hypothetical protein